MTAGSKSATLPSELNEGLRVILGGLCALLSRSFLTSCFTPDERGRESMPPDTLICELGVPIWRAAD